MKNLISIYALLSSKIFQVILFILIICLLLPEDMSKYYAPIAAVGILLALGFGFCKLFNISLGYFYFFGVLTTFIIGPYFGLTVFIIYLSCLFAYFSNPKNINLGTDKEDKTKPKKVKNPFTDNNVNIDEPVTVEPFIKVRDAINTIDINTVTPKNLYKKLEEIEEIAGIKIFRKETTSVQSLKELHTALTHIDLDSMETVTLQELFDIDEDDAYEYEKKYNRQPGRDYSKKIKHKKEDLTTAESIGLVAGTDAALNYMDKKKRIKQKREEVENLENEYRFERGYDPDFDEDEGLSSGIKDEEKYLDARKQELQQKNIAYDQYLSPEEREDEE